MKTAVFFEKDGGLCFIEINYSFRLSTIKLLVSFKYFIFVTSSRRNFVMK